MAERKFISDAEYERRLEERLYQEWRKEQEEWEKEHPEALQEWIAESNRKFAECKVGTGWDTKQPQKVQSRVLDGTNDKWEHGEMFYPHPVWWKNPEYME